MTVASQPRQSQSGSRLIVRLARRLGLSPIPAETAERLAELEGAVIALTQVQTENQKVLDALQEAVTRLEKQLVRAGKEQFKANTLAEAQQKNVKTLFEQAREAEAYRERELAQLRERLAQARGASRLDVIKSLFPVLDGLDEALAAGDRLLSQAGPLGARTAPPPVSPGWRGRLGAALSAWRSGPAAEPIPAEPGTTLAPEAVSAWLAGLSLVQERLADILAAEGVTPIVTEDEPFDPHQHVAVETVPATADIRPGTITRELRRGYRTADNVLRYAEVTVARQAQETAAK
jgi:molecular chaperone GrpE (heat shock protein)